VQKNEKKILELETVDLECFFGKKGLSPLRVNFNFSFKVILKLFKICNLNMLLSTL
jgi:hypothetical protein